jgi:sugar/nucleoside kinase (ribokinase family)
MGLDVVTIGDSVVDIIIQVPRFPTGNEETVRSKGMCRQLGGSSNFLIMSARLGLKVGVIDQVGDDDLGEFYVSNLASEAVDVSQLRTVSESQTAHCICLVDKKGNHVYISFPGATYDLPVKNIEQEIIESSKVLYISGYSLTKNPIREATIKALDIATKNGVRVYFDPSPRVSNIPPETLRRVVEHSNGLFLNERELERINRILEVDVQDCCDFTALKQGNKGCTVYTRGEANQYPVENVVVVDTTGAGDVFNSTFIYGLLMGWKLPKCARFANLMAAEKVKTLGAGLNVPTRNQSLGIISEM